ncbi:MAG: tail fiber protein [Magnetococcales bacterium]|nr:tail fiber protein [Magnetococcales bacterium]MBF0116189.1 tail fiber protein [Magnetococcales bacterium]
MDPYVGMIMSFPYPFAPVGWTFCAGQEMPVMQYQALFSLIGSLYGGDERTKFNLPELRGRMIIGAGVGQAGLSTYNVAQKGGAENIALSANQMPPHTHTATFKGTGGSADTPLKVTVQVTGKTDSNSATPDATHSFLGSAIVGMDTVNTWTDTLANPVELGGVKATGSGGGITGGTVTVNPAGAGQRFPLLNPYLAMNFCIALTGVYPERPS